uniref:(northern house mosquito) hypothetical protein n=1 Tax=Culex pipiens TaxID=7175 RepID=A0A8D8PBP6_CULPI
MLLDSLCAYLVFSCFYYYFGSLVTFTCFCVFVFVCLFCSFLQSFICVHFLYYCRFFFSFKYLSLLCGSSHYPSVSRLLLAVYQFNYEFPLLVVDYLCVFLPNLHSFKFFPYLLSL